MDAEQTIAEIECLEHIYAAPDTRPLSRSDLSAVNRRHDEKQASSSLGGNPILRRLKDNEETPSVGQSQYHQGDGTARGLISPDKGRDPRTVVWRLKKKIN
jgi:hypothetical protein